MSQPSFGAKVRSGVIWSLVQNWGARLGGLLVFMVLARLLSPSEMGLFAAATTVVAFCALFVDSGLSEAVVQTQEVTPRQLSTVFIINLLMALVVLVSVWLAAPALAVYFKLPELTLILRVSVFTVVLNALAFSQMAMMRRAFQYKQLALITLGGTALSGSIAVGIALAGFGAWSLVAQSLIAAAYTAALLWMRPAWQLEWHFSFGSISGLLSYGVKRLLTALMDFANTRFIELFFASVFGAATLGLYVVGARVYQILMQVLCSSVLDIAHNAFSRLAHEPEKLKEAYYSALGLAAATSMPIFFMLAMVSNELVVGVFGNQWTEAGAVLVPLLILGGIQVLQFFNGILYNALGRPGIGLVFMIGKTIITMAVLFAAKDLSFLQVVWAYFFSQIVTTPVSFMVAKQVVGISYRRILKQIGPFAVALLAALSAMEGLQQVWSTGMPIADMLLLLACGGAVFVVVAFALAKRHLLEIIQMLRRPQVGSA
jgi:O-antigen/teichoic acid export membrane protein